MTKTTPNLLPAPYAALCDQARLVIRRLERLSVDSAWAHRASGYRGALLRQLDRLESLDPAVQVAPKGRREAERLQAFIQVSFTILENAAREIPDEKKP